MQECVNYERYRLSMLEEAKCLGIVLLLSVVAAWLLYKNPWGMILGIVLYPLYRANYKKIQIEKRKKELLLQFKDAMGSVAVALKAGYSIENSWCEAWKELQELYGDGACMTEEMKQMNVAIQMNQPVEQVLYQFACRSGCDDIIGFAEIFLFAKRSGGNFGKIIENTVRHIAEKLEVEREIETVLAGKRMEQKIMNVVPICLIAYLNLTSQEFLMPLYGNFGGAGVMTLAFFAYVGAVMLANKMINIKV